MIQKSQSSVLYRKEDQAKSLYYSVKASSILSATTQVAERVSFNGVYGFNAKVQQADLRNDFGCNIAHSPFNTRSKAECKTPKKLANSNLTIVWDDIGKHCGNDRRLPVQHSDAVMDVGYPIGHDVTMIYGFTDLNNFDLSGDNRINYHLNLCHEAHHGWAIVTSLEHSFTISSWTYSDVTHEDTYGIPELSETTSGLAALILGLVGLRGWLLKQSGKDFR